MIKLTARERRFLQIMYPDGTVARGLRIGAELHHRGLLTMARWGRYGLTPKGIEALQQYDLGTEQEEQEDEHAIDGGNVTKPRHRGVSPRPRRKPRRDRGVARRNASAWF